MYEETPQWHLRVAYYLVSHQVMIKRLLIFALFFINIIIWSWGIVKTTNYLTTIKAHEYMLSLMGKNLVNYDAYRAHSTPQSLSTLLTTAISNGHNYDFLAKVKNPNDKWAIAKIKYRFSHSTGSTETKTDFILPGQEKYLFAFSQDTQGSPSNTKLIIEETNWLRVSNENSLKVLSDFSVDNELFSNLENTSTVNFDVTNSSVFSFWTVGAQVVLYSGGSPSAASYIALNDIHSMTTTRAQANWFKKLSTPSDIDIILDVNYLDQNSFIKNTPGPGVPKGYEEIDRR